MLAVRASRVSFSLTLQDPQQTAGPGASSINCGTTYDVASSGGRRSELHREVVVVRVGVVRIYRALLDIPPPPWTSPRHSYRGCGKRSAVYFNRADRKRGYRPPKTSRASINYKKISDPRVRRPRQSTAAARRRRTGSAASSSSWHRSTILDDEESLWADPEPCLSVPALFPSP